MNYLNNVLIEGKMDRLYAYTKGDKDNESKIFFILSWFDFHNTKKIDVPCVAYGDIADSIDKWGERGLRIVGKLTNNENGNSLTVKVEHVEFKAVLKNMK